MKPTRKIATMTLFVSLLLLLASNGFGQSSTPSGDVIVSSNTTWSAGTYQLTSLTVNSGAVFTIGGGSTLNVSGAITVTGSSAIVLQSTNISALVNGVWAGAGVTLNAASVEVDASSSINADGQGYALNAGPGGAPLGSGVGGSYGGVGAGGGAAAVYGSSTAPADLGSGGGCASSGCGAAGAGGGAILLNVSGTLTDNGIISANGGAAGSYTGPGGGGSGGSVYINTGVLAGTGVFTANGGGLTSGYNNSNGGGGGRVAVYYGANSNFTGFAASTALGGNGNCGSCSGGNGTIGFFDTSAANSNVNIYRQFTLPAGTTVSYNNLTVQPNATLTVGGDSQISVTNTLEVGGTLVLQATNTSAQVGGVWAGVGVTINAAAVQVDAAGWIDADSQGYALNAGPGGAPGGSGVGGSYGGVGGGAGAAAVYGSATAPTDLGSGGGCNGCSYAGAGGGAILMNVSGTLTDNGIISANGGNSGNYSGPGGGGSGGSVNIHTGVLAGTGSIAANGGASNSTTPGGGGRIAVYYATNSSFNLALVTANGGSGNPNGGAGTVYTLGTLGANVNLTVSDDMVLPANSNLTYNSITIDNQGSLTLGSGTTLTANSLSVSNGGTFTVGGGSTVTLSGQLLVTGNSHVVLQGANTAAQVNGVWAGVGVTLNAASVEVDAGSSINADSQGYALNAGPGGAPSGSGAGGSYGGVGAGGGAAAVYGSSTAPADLGSGGGCASSGCGTAGAGGGVILLNVSGTLTDNGIISANGGAAGSYTGPGGGGSGGSVYVTAGSLLGAGVFTANGGGLTSGYNNSNGGGGGRVAVYYGANSNFTGFAASTALGGNGACGSCSGGNGTIGFFDTSAANSNVNIYQQFTLPAGTTVNYNNLTVQPNATLTVGGGSQISVTNTLEVGGTLVLRGANTSAQVGGVWAGVGVTINAAAVQVDAAGWINADSQGYALNAGPGGAPSQNGVGGSYGGVGGGAGAAAVYGSATAPTDLGSGGGCNGCSYAGAGGGAILMNVSGTLTDNGTISANGGNSANYSGPGGGGSGGSVNIHTGVLAGAGSIAANGGTSTSTTPGGGGRIAVYYATNSGFNLTLVTANGGSGNPNGGAGTVYLLAAGTNLTVADNTVLPANANLTYTGITIDNQGSLTLGSGTTLTANSLSVSNGGTFTVGGGSTVTVSGQLLVTGNSHVILQGANTAAQVNGVWAGAGVTLNAASVEVDAGSSINADGQGYALNAGPGGAPLGSGVGGSYGGVGGGGGAAAIYGSATTPIDLGSGGGCNNCSYAGVGGGAVLMNVSGTLTDNGIISANGGHSANYSGPGGGGSGGSVYINAGVLAGTGSIAANGGASSSNTPGGGGRIAVYYVTNSGFNLALITANGGSGNPNGGSGTVTQSNTPRYLWVAPTSTELYGTQTLQWMAGAVDLATTTVTVTASGPQILTLGSALNPNASLKWDTTTVPDGRYELRLIYLDGSGNTLQELPRTVVINNSVAWHSGTIAGNQEWTANQVQGISGTVIVPAGVTLTIDPGTIVKALPGAQIVVQSGGILNAAGSSSLPVIFTAFDDSSVGGDTDFTGGLSAATPGEWNGISVQGGGEFNTNSYTGIRYGALAEGGTLTANTAWLGSQLYQVTSTVVVPAGVTLTIQPGTIVKFGANAGISVQAGGQLIAQGTLAQPIYFTSLNDDSLGSAAIGSSGTPAPGDWGMIAIDGGNASFDHVHLLYGGGPPNASGMVGMIETGGAANVTVTNSVLANSFWVGIQTAYPGGGDTVTVTNTTFYGIEDRGINAWGGSTVHLVNDTFDNNALGVMNHGGATVDMANTIVTNCKTNNWSSCVWGDVTAVNSDVWANHAGVANYSGGDLAGSNGNISADPVYVNAAQHDYRLNYGSPAIDAGNGTVANYPLTDQMGDPRYNDPEVEPKTGVADPNGNYPDMGALEFVQTAVSDINLTVPSVTGPSSAVSGSQVQLSWTDSNTGSGTAQGPWHDAIYLVQDPDTNPVLLPAGEVLVASGVTLGPGDSYTATSTVRVPGGVVGNYRWEVKTNDRGEVFVGQNSANSTGISLDMVAIDLPELVVDSPALTNSFAAVGQSWWYKITPGAGKGVSLTLTLAGGTSAGAVQLFIGQGYVPDAQHFDIQQVEWNSPSASLVIPKTSSQTYYVTAYAQSLSSAPAAFSLAATSLKYSLSSVQPGTAVNSGSATLTFVGGGFTSNGTYQLAGANGALYTASSVFVTDSAHASVTFAMTGVPVGSYAAQVTENGNTVSLSNALAVTAAITSGAYTGCFSPPTLSAAVSRSAGPVATSGGYCLPAGPMLINVEAPQELRAGFPAVITLNYTNVSAVDLPAPLILLSATGANLAPVAPQCNGCNPNFSLMYQNTFSSGMVLGINREGPAGVLPAGAQGSVAFLATPTGGNVTFSTQYINETLSDPLIGYGVPVSIPPPVSSAVACQDDPLMPGCGGPSSSASARAIAGSGGLPSGYISIGAYADAAALCAAFQPPWANPAGFSRTCMQLLVNSGYQYGTCGASGCGSLDGSSLNNQLAADATALSQTGIYESDGAKLMRFELQNDGLQLFNRRYHQGAFGFGVSHNFDLTAALIQNVPTVYYPDGSVRQFPTSNPANSNQYLGTPGDYGVLTAAADNSWTITESNGIVYNFILDPQPNTTGRQLLNSIQDLNGNRITLAYANDLVTGVSDTSGNTIAFSYDSFGHIVQATDPMGRVTTYTYDTKNDTLNSAFLTSVTNSSGTVSLTWNEGGPSGVGYFDDSCVSTYCEPAIGVNTITYPDGTHSYYTYDSLGRLASQSNDNSAQTLTYGYGSTGAVTITDAAGNVSKLMPDAYGSLVRYTDPLGAVTQLSYDPEDRLTGIQKALGTYYSFGYDVQGNPISLLNPLGNEQNLSYTAANNPLSFTDASGNATEYVYDSRYNQTATTYPDGSAEQYTYDNRGNVTSWTNRRGHTVAYAYNSQNLLLSKTYADGDQVSYTYDGHRNRLTSTTPYGTTHFTYDFADRLTGIGYPSGQSIQYAYNDGGQRTSMTDSTGFSVNYAYDAVGRLSQLTNGSGAPIVSYTYDAAGRLTKKLMGNGTYTAYAYDADGNLLHLINYASGGAVLSEFDYAYDALGNRTTMNAPSGAWTYGYDANSEIASVTLPGDSVQYTYDAAGNRASASINGSGIGFYVNNLNQYTAAGANSYRYDADGNLISGGGWTYSYNDENRLIAAASATDSWSYRYDGLGNRVATTHNGTVTQYLNDLSGFGNVEAEFNGSGQLVSHYTYGLDLTSSIPAGATAAYYHFDGSGNTVQMTDASGSVVNSYSYLPFGEKLSSTVGVNNPFTYVGESGVIDEGSGLYFMRNRWYSAALGRFVQQDPMRLAGGSNLYSYTQNNPITWADPLGTQEERTGTTDTESARGGASDYRDLVNTSLNQTQDTNINYIASSQEYAAHKEYVENGAKESVVETGTKLAILATAPELEFVENPVGNAVLNEGLHKAGEEAVVPVVNKVVGVHEEEHHSNVIPVIKDMMNYFSFGYLFKKQSEQDTTVPTGQARDPNGKLTSGFGDQGYIPPNTPIVYTIYFENQASATAPAEIVTVTDPLASNLDWSTVQLNQIQFNNVLINVPGGQQSYAGQVNVSTDPNPVNVNASLNAGTGVLTWTMQSVNSVTGGLPADPMAGFLPPNNSSNRGTGYVTFSVKPVSGLANGTTITNQASIVFDVNAAIGTNTVTNTIDSVYPTSSVDALPVTTTSTTFTVSWSGSDPAGAGIAGYDIFVSIDSGPYTLWIPATTATSASYPAAVGHTYSFYSMATDNVGHRQQTAGQVQTTTVAAGTSTATSTTTSLTSSVNPAAAGASITFTATVTGTGAIAPTGSVDFLDGSTTIGSEALSGTTATFPTSSLAAGSHSITAHYNGDSNNAASSSASLTQVVTTGTTTALTSSSNPAAVGASVTFTATVTGSGTIAPTGSVAFLDGSTTIGSRALSGTTATFSTSGLAAGAHSITASYPGDSNNAASTSAVLTETVSSSPFTFTASSGTSASLTLVRGQSGTMALTVTPQEGFAEQISFACSGLPADVTCSFSPATVTPQGGAATTTMTVASGLTAVSRRRGGLPWTSGLLLAGCCLGWAAPRKRKAVAVLLTVAIGLGAMLTGCGTSQKATTSTFAVTASAGTVQQTIDINLTLQ
jgi:RHS repeat-associated protein